MSIDETFVAYHEAGHAVAAFDQRLRYKYVSIIPDDKGSLGQVQLASFPEDFQPDIDVTLRDRLRIEKIVIINFAGSMAEAKYRGEEPEYGAECADDWKSAMDLASYACGSPEEEEAYVNWLFVRAKNMFNVPHIWQMVEGLAKELLVRKKIGYQTSREIMKEAAGFLKANLVDGKIVLSPYKRH